MAAQGAPSSGHPGGGTAFADPDVLEHHLRSLDRDACAALVADLWAARGFAVARDGDAVAAVRDGRTIVLFPLVRERGHTPDDPHGPVDGDVDVVVAPTGHRDAVSAAARHDARVVDAAELRQLLLWAIDRETAAALCERHLGARPTDLPAPLRARVGRSARGVVARSPSAPALVAVLGALVVVTATAAGVVPTRGLSSPVTGGVDLLAGPDPAPAGLSDVGDALPPGVTDDGVTDLDRLADAHARVVGSGSYSIRMNLYRPRNGTPGSRRVRHDVDVAVADDRYRLTSTVDAAGSRTGLREIYHDGTGWYVLEPPDGNASGQVIQREEPPDTVVPGPFVLRRSLVTRFLSTPETDVTATFTESGYTQYRLVGRGQPSSPALADVRNYEFRGVVDERGFVRKLIVEYAVETGEGRYRVKFGLRYGLVGETTVVAPGWYDRWVTGGDEAVNATATAVGLHPAGPDGQ